MESGSGPGGRRFKSSRPDHSFQYLNLFGIAKAPIHVHIDHDQLEGLDDLEGFPVPLYLCRWPNGDCSFVLAPNKGAAIEALDELANAEGCSLTILRDFMVHFRLSDSGELEFEGLGEATEKAVFEQAYPVLEETRLNVPCD